MRKKLILTLFLSALFLSTASITFAYLTDSDLAENKVSLTENEIHIEEEFVPPEEVTPGTVITKKPRIVNDSKIPVYVRMAVHFTDSAAEAFCEPFLIDSGWELRTDGYYYYKNVLNPGQKTSALFTTVKIKENAAAEELIPFDLLVYAESVQADGMSEEEAWKFYWHW